ncbi:MAG: peptidase C39 family protein, partial [Actinomycetes bacterium]
MGIVSRVRTALSLPRVAAALTAVLAMSLLSPLPAEAARARQISYTQWASGAQFRTGTLAGVRVAKGTLRIARPVSRIRYDDPHGARTKTYAFGHWTSPWRRAGYGLTELIASWDAYTRGDSWIQVQTRGRTSTGRRTSWDTLARWAPGDSTFHRTSDGSQPDDLAGVATDTWVADRGVSFTSWQLRVTLFRKVGTGATPFVDTVGAMTSRLPRVGSVRT